MKKHKQQKVIYGNSERSNRQGSKFLRRRWVMLKESTHLTLHQPTLEFNLQEDIMAAQTRMMRSP